MSVHPSSRRLSLLSRLSGLKWTLGNFYNPTITKVYGGKNIYSVRISYLNRFDIKRISKYFKFKFKIGDKVEVYYQPNNKYKEQVLCEVTQHRLRYDHKKKKCYPAYCFKVLNSEDFSPAIRSSIIREIDNYSEPSMRLHFNYDKFWDAILNEQ